MIEGKHYRIVRFEAENIKRLKAVRITPDGSIVQLSGPNAAGKSSILDAIFYAMAGSRGIPSEPIRAGEQSARVRLDLGEIIVTRKFTADGPRAGVLTVEADTGARFPSAQTMLDQMFGALSFDALRFSRMNGKEQLAELAGLVKIDVNLDELDAANKEDFEERRAINADVKRLEALRLTVSAQLPDVEPEAIDDNALLDAMRTSAEENGRRADERRRRGAIARSVEEKRQTARDQREEAERLIASALANDAEAGIVEDGQKSLAPVGDDVDVAEVQARLLAAKTSNHTRSLFAQFRDLATSERQRQADADALTAAMEKRVQERNAAVERAAMPVAGLGFGDGEVLYNGVPFAQASRAETIRVSIGLAMAKNPTLRVLRIEDGSLLDPDSLKLIEELADANDFQVWVESVAVKGAGVGFIIDDGEVVAHVARPSIDLEVYSESPAGLREREQIDRDSEGR